MHPMIKPALRRAWRDRQTVQYGVSPAHAVLLGPVDDGTAGFLDRLDGTRGMDLLRKEAARFGLGAGAADRLTERLSAAGVLDDATADRAASACVADALRADAASLSVVHPQPGAGPRRLAARRAARVQVRGAGRVGAAVAATLSAAGVGQVDVVDGGQVEPWEVLPAGMSGEHVGARRDDAARACVRRASPWRRGDGRRRGGTADGQDGISLVVLTPRDGLDAYAPDPAGAEEQVAAGVPHLYGGVVEATGVVGPLVLPGVTACAGCAFRSRADREPTWPLVVGQWRTGGRRRGGGVAACDAALATVVAGATASYALSFLDGDGACAGGYRLRLVLPHLLGETEQFSPHPECPCGAAAFSASAPATGGGAGPAPEGAPPKEVRGEVHNGGVGPQRGGPDRKGAAGRERGPGSGAR